MNKQQRYEAAKRALQSKGLSAKEYEKAIKALARMVRI